ncbi:hypothetical protein ACHAXS_001794 [Conticribra weissflogii]
MRGVAINSTTHVDGDNMSVIKNTSKQETTLNKKINAVCYHTVRESCAMRKPYSTYPWSRKSSRPHDKSIVRKQAPVSSAKSFA